MDLNSIVSLALDHKDYILLAVALVAMVVPVVLKALGKDVPIIDSLLEAVVGLVEKLRASKNAAPPPADPSKPDGIAAVVPIETAKKDEVKK
jgi:hypothetical protein